MLSDPTPTQEPQRLPVHSEFVGVELVRGNSVVEPTVEPIRLVGDELWKECRENVPTYEEDDDDVSNIQVGGTCPTLGNGWGPQCRYFS